jgi:hypothetical protein
MVIIHHLSSLVVGNPIVSAGTPRSRSLVQFQEGLKLSLSHLDCIHVSIYSFHTSELSGLESMAGKVFVIGYWRAHLYALSECVGWRGSHERSHGGWSMVGGQNCANSYANGS